MMRQTRNQWKAKAVAALIFIAAAEAAAQDAAATTPPAPRVIVSIADRKLAVMENGRAVRIFDVAVGAPVSPSPTGTFRIVNRIPEPTYYHPGKVIGPGKANPLGTRWIGLSVKGFGIHGTNAPRSIGRAASHGCIRLRNSDVEQLFEMLSVGDVVELRAELEQQTAQLFAVNPVTD